MDSPSHALFKSKLDDFLKTAIGQPEVMAMLLGVDHVMYEVGLDEPHGPFWP